MFSSSLLFPNSFSYKGSSSGQRSWYRYWDTHFFSSLLQQHNTTTLLQGPPRSADQLSGASWADPSAQLAIPGGLASTKLRTPIPRKQNTTELKDLCCVMLLYTHKIQRNSSVSRSANSQYFFSKEHRAMFFADVLRWCSSRWIFVYV